jgi:serine/threonine protein kinase/predicted ATPase/DNA-binding SARP family transcriptional activator/alpha-beta hydrolase superfamily lysophospholipase
MAALQFFLLGAPRLEQQHQTVNLSRRKAIAALAYLVVTRQPHSRDELATLLWPDQDQSGARANLRRDLSTLKQLLGDHTLLVDQALVGLNPEADLWSDVEAFQSNVLTAQKHSHANGHVCDECAIALKAAVDLYNGDFMAGFSLPDSPEFDEWQFFETERLRQLFAEALQHLIGWHTDRLEYEPAIAYARRWLALDALHEPAHRQLMQLYAWAGQHAAALRQYQECTRLLEEELGVPPDAETTVLYEAIRTRQIQPPTTESIAAPTAAEPELRERYRTERLLEVGGYGEVYLGRDSVTGQPVVIKRLKPELVAEDPAFVARFVREAEALRQLNHPNIVAILATIEQDGEQCIVMEYVPGGTLRNLLERERPLSYERSLAITLELADALSRAHHLNIIHRDLKPDNVLLAADGTPRLTDFGMARLSHDDVRLTQPGMIAGSPAYLSPEALRGEELDARSDIWSFGVLLYELLAGHPPFDGQQLMTVLSNILHAPVPNIAQVRSDVPRPLADLLQRMLTKDRDERIASMRQVAAELEAIRARRSIQHEAVRSPTEALASSVTTGVGITGSESAPQREFEQSIHFCQSPDGVRLAYATIGAGPPLVKAANWLSHLEYDWQSPIWRHWLIGLAQQHTLFRYDERGCGLSDWNVNDLSFEAWVRDLETVVDAVGVERFPLIGLSQGGPIAMAYAIRHPERVSHLILYGSYARGKLKRDLTAAQADEVETLVKLIRLGWGRENPAFRQVFTSMFIPDATLEQYRWFNDLQRASASPENAARIVEGFNMIDVRHLAAQLNIPTLVLHARGDMRIPFEEGRLLASLIPDARLVTLESHNHILLEHEPAWQRFLSEVHQFLATPDRSNRHRAPAHPIDSPHPIGSTDRPQARHRLPVQLTPFIGREHELGQLHRLLVDDPACRLLALIGPGGIGKTRLAIEAAAQAADAFQEGVALVTLASVSTADLILPALSEALNFNMAGTAAPRDQLLNYLRDKHLLLIFDNFEHVLSGVEVLADILRAALGVKIVATSRERLNVMEEWVYEVSGMAFPRAADLPPADGAQVLEKYSAIRLFVQRARQTVVSFAPTSANITAIAQICELVEGSPLAIELAAAWVNVLDCAAIAEEVQRGLDVLTTQQRDMPEHHRSMRAVFDRTWERLTDDERRVFQQLSVFRGGFRRAAAEQVADASLAILSALVNKSLLRWDPIGRYQVHELLRQYAASQLAQSAEDKARSYDRHGRYYAALLEESFKQILDGRQLEVTHRIETELGNLRAAWSWAINHSRVEFVQYAVPMLWTFHEYRSRYLEGAELLDRALACLNEQPRSDTVDRGRVLTQVLLAWLYIRLGRLDEAEDCAQEALAGYKRLGISPVLGIATDPRVALGILASIRGDYPAMIRLGEEAVQLSEEYDHRWNRPYAYYLLTRAAVAQGDYEQAQRYAQQASKAAQESKDRWFLAYCLIELGNVALAQDQFAVAKEHYQTSYAIRQEFADREGMALALNRLATATFRQQSYAEARSLYLQSLDLYRELDDKGGLASTINGLGFVASGQADYETAAKYFYQALQIAQELRFTPLIVWILLGIGEMLLKIHQIERGVELLSLVEHHPAAEREASLRARLCLDQFRDQLSPAEFTAIDQRGQQLDLDHFIETILTDLPQLIVTRRTSMRSGGITR